MGNLQSYWVILPTIAVWIWHNYRIGKLQDQLDRLELRLLEEKNSAFSANMLQAVQQVLADDDEARTLHGLPPYSAKDN